MSPSTQSPAQHLLDQQQEARSRWRKAVARDLLPADATVRQRWDDRSAVEALLQALGSTHATTVIVQDDYALRERMPESPQALYALLLGAEPPASLAVALEYIPHPQDMADAAFVLTLRPDPSRDDALQALLAQDLGLAVTMIGVMNQAIDADGLEAAFTQRTIRRVESADPIASVEAAFREHRGAGVTRPLDQTDVDVIAWAAMLAGLKPTMELVRRIAGGGSNSTIHPKLDAFFDRLPDRLRQAERPSVPAPLLAIWKDLCAAAATETENRMAPRRAHLDAVAQQLATERDTLAAATAAFAEARAQAEAIDAERQRFVAHLQEQLAERDASLVVAQELAAAHEASVHRLDAEATELRAQRRDLQTAMTEATAARDAAREDATRQRSALETVTEERDRLQHQVDRLIQENTQLTAVAATLRGERDHAASQLGDQKRATEQLRSEVAAGQQKLQQAIARISLADDHGRGLQFALDTLRERVTQLETELDTTRADRDDARIQQARLSGVEQAHAELVQALRRGDKGSLEGKADDR